MCSLMSAYPDHAREREDPSNANGKCHLDWEYKGLGILI